MTGKGHKEHVSHLLDVLYANKDVDRCERLSKPVLNTLQRRMIHRQPWEYQRYTRSMMIGSRHHKKILPDHKKELVQAVAHLVEIGQPYEKLG